MGIRTELRHQNLYDAAPADAEAPPPGAAGRHFGRNQPLWGIPRPTPEEILEPNPREVSSRLLARRGPMREVPFLNLLAAAWLQFMVHDWMSHGPGAPGEEIRVPLAEDDDFAARSPGDEMLIRRSRPSALADGRRAAGVRQHRDRAGGTARRSTAARPSARPCCARAAAGA